MSEENLEKLLNPPPLKSAELITMGVYYLAMQGFRREVRLRRESRPVYCEICGRHYTMLKPEGVPWAPTVVHVDCNDCGGNGLPRTLEAPR